MLEVLPSLRAVILVNGHVLEAAVLLEVENAAGGEEQELFDAGVRRLPELPVVLGIFNQHLVGPDRLHLVVKAFGKTLRIAFHMKHRLRMHNCAGGPGSTIDGRLRRDHLDGNLAVGAITAPTFIFGDSGWVVSGDNPGAGDRVLAELHALQESTWAGRKSIRRTMVKKRWTKSEILRRFPFAR